MTRSRWWPHARAALLTVVVAGNLLYAVPFPRKHISDDDREAWRQSDIEMWHGWLTSAGLTLSLPAFHDRVVDGSNQLWSLGQWVHAPVKPFFRTLRTTQQWGLFGVVSESPEALVVEIRRGETWQVVERRLDPEHDWRDTTFLYRRVRGTWDTVRNDQPAPLYDAFSRWTARQAFADFPDAEEVRIHRSRFVVNAPWENVEAEPKVLHERSFTRGATTLWVLK